MTLEDETGFVNLVIWQKVFESFSILARTAYWLGVTGKIESQSRVVHVMAEEQWTPETANIPKRIKSRDFH